MPISIKYSMNIYKFSLIFFLFYLKLFELTNNLIRAADFTKL